MAEAHLPAEQTPKVASTAEVGNSSLQQTLPHLKHLLSKNMRLNVLLHA
jgi:hypothetical protein